MYEIMKSVISAGGYKLADIQHKVKKLYAIVMANPIAKEMAREYGISAKKTASILDTFSCIFQGIIPYGAQMLVAVSAVAQLGGEVSAFDIIPNWYYPFMLFLSSFIFIFLVPEKKEQPSYDKK